MERFFFSVFNYRSIPIGNASLSRHSAERQIFFFTNHSIFNTGKVTCIILHSKYRDGIDQTCNCFCET